MDQAVAALIKEYPLPSPEEKFPTWNDLHKRVLCANYAETGYSVHISDRDPVGWCTIRCGQIGGPGRRTGNKCEWQVAAQRTAIDEHWNLLPPAEPLKHTHHPANRPGRPHTGDILKLADNAGINFWPNVKSCQPKSSRRKQTGKEADVNNVPPVTTSRTLGSPSAAKTRAGQPPAREGRNGKKADVTKPQSMVSGSGTDSQIRGTQRRYENGAAAPRERTLEQEDGTATPPRTKRHIAEEEHTTKKQKKKRQKAASLAVQPLCRRRKNIREQEESEDAEEDGQEDNSDYSNGEEAESSGEEDRQPRRRTGATGPKQTKIIDLTNSDGEEQEEEEEEDTKPEIPLADFLKGLSDIYNLEDLLEPLKKLDIKDTAHLKRFASEFMNTFITALEGVGASWGLRNELRLCMKQCLKEEYLARIRQ